MMDEPIRYSPNPGPQTKYLRCSSDIVIYGGSAGGGKTRGLLLSPLSIYGDSPKIENPKYGMVIFRRTYSDIENEGGLWDESCEFYQLLGAKQNGKEKSHTFNSGACVSFSHMQYDLDRFNHKGGQYPEIGFDELTDFSSVQFWYLFGRNRSVCGIPAQTRCTTNPDCDSWVRKFVDWYIDNDTGYAIKERSGVERYFVRDDTDVTWFDKRGPAQEHADKRKLSVNSFTFIRAELKDNPKGDPTYENKLRALDLVERERLLMGNWNIKYTKGNVFKEEHFRVVDALPKGMSRFARYWDRAATEGGGDWTAGVKLGMDADRRTYVADVVRGQWGPRGVEQAIRATAERDGGGTVIYLEQEPGSSGVADVQALIRMLAGWDVHAFRRTGSKLDMARPLAAQVEAGNVFLLRGPWNKDFINECVAFDGEGKGHDDQVDAASGAYAKLARPMGVIGKL